jgi:hypothetical protein
MGRFPKFPKFAADTLFLTGIVYNRTLIRIGIADNIDLLVDQAQQHACQLFQSVWGKLGSKRSLWENIRSLFFGFKFDSMKDILIALLYGFKRDYPVILEDPPPSG